MTAHKPTAGLSVSLSRPPIGRTGRAVANFTEVRIGSLTLWFSYETVIAFHTPATGYQVRENNWGPTTGKHINYVLEQAGQSKSACLPAETFTGALDKVLPRG